MKTKNAATLSVHLSDDIIEMVVRRAEALGVSKSRYAAMIFEKWKAEKYPALSTVDSTARAVVAQQINDENSRALNPEHMAAHEEGIITDGGKGSALSEGKPAPKLKAKRGKLRRNSNAA